MTTPAAALSARLAQEAEAVCRFYLSAGRRHGRYWLVGDARNTPGRSLYVGLTGESAGQWSDAATGEHGDLLDLIRLARGCTTLRETLDEARTFLRLPAHEGPVPAACISGLARGRRPAVGQCPADRRHPG